MQSPLCHDYKLGVEEGDKKVQGENIVCALDTVSKNLAEDEQEHITISIRAKDKDGKWYFTCITKPLKDLVPGDEFLFDTHNITKLIAE